MDSKIQPILCCVGDAVAGRPTQFLMERAFDAANFDWRVITVEVQQSSFQLALDGMRAMKFTALRIFPEFQQLAASLLAAQPSSPFSAVTSVMRQGDTWAGWDNQGFGLLDLIADQTSPASTLLWLHGHSRLTYSVFAAIQAGEYAPRQCLWSVAGAAEANSDSPQSAQQPPLGQQTSRPEPVQELDQISLVELGQALKGLLAQPNEFTHLAMVGGALADQLPLLSQLAVIGELQLLLATDQTLTRQQVAAAWSSGQATFFTESDQLIAAEAYDFRRWTGQPADVDLLRDAYEEYADF